LAIEKTYIELWDAFKEGDAQAFVSLFKQLYPILFHYGKHIVKRDELVEDAILEVFEETWQTEKKPQIASPKAYFISAVKYKLLKVVIKENKQNTLIDGEEAQPFVLSPESLMINQEENNELREKVLAAIVKLSNRQKEIIYLKYYLNFSYEDISDVMKINYQASRNLLHHSLQSLRKIIGILVTVGIWRMIMKGV
jgi:RNA polymerase sigma factor (sigma-70 family)